jgi:DNA-directed RNA polymerase subunit K/omega
MAKYIVNPVQLRIKESEKGSIYESIVAMGKRSRQINDDIKNELRLKLEDLHTTDDEIISYNQDKVDIVKGFERYPKPIFIAMKEKFEEKLKYNYPDEDAEITTTIINDYLKK